MREPLDLQAEARRWRSTGASHEQLIGVLNHLIAQSTHALEEQAQLVEALRRELLYSLCWPEGRGDESLVSRAYQLMGQARFPIPDDPEPIRHSLSVQEERLDELTALTEEAKELRRMLEEWTDGWRNGGMDGWRNGGMEEWNDG